MEEGELVVRFAMASHGAQEDVQPEIEVHNHVLTFIILV